MATRVVFLRKITGHLSMVIFESFFLMEKMWLFAAVMLATIFITAKWLPEVNYTYRKSKGYRGFSAMALLMLPLVTLIGSSVPYLMPTFLLSALALAIYFTVLISKELKEREVFPFFDTD